MIVVTGATGQLGQIVVEALLNGGVPANEIVAAVRSPEKAKGWAERGVLVRKADYDRPETLAAAFAGADKVLLISSNELDKRLAQHRAAIDATKAAGVRLLAYTSILNADRSENMMAKDHVQTETYLRQSGVPYTLLRNGWYTENQTGALAPAIEHGAILGCSGEGRYATAARKDYAEAAARVLTGTGHENQVYELGGDTPHTMVEFAAEVSRQAGKPVEYRNLSQADYAAALAGFGLPEPVAQMVADADTGASRGELTTASGDLHRLLGRATEPLAETIRAALA